MARDRVHWTQKLFMPAAGPGRERAWQPSVDVYRTRDGWLIKFDLAGVRSEDLTLSVDGSRVTVRGTRRDCSLEEGCCHYLLEISYSPFERTVELPEDLGGAALTTEFHAGMLLVRLRHDAPCTEAPR